MTTPKRADRSEQILQAAIDVFSEQGFERATTRAIAKRAGVAEGTIFNYFPTKRDILISILKQRVLDTIPPLDTNGNAVDVMEMLLANRLRMWKEHAGIMNVMVFEAVFDEQFRKLFHDNVFKVGISRVEGYIQAMQKGGLLADADCKMISRMMLGIVLGFGLMNIVAGEAGEPEELAHKLTELVYNGLKHRSEEPTPA